MSAIEAYFIAYINFDSLMNCFCIFMVSRLRYYISDINIGFLDSIIKATAKVI